MRNSRGNFNLLAIPTKHNYRGCTISLGALLDKAAYSPNAPGGPEERYSDGHQKAVCSPVGLYTQDNLLISGTRVRSAPSHS